MKTLQISVLWYPASLLTCRSSNAPRPSLKELQFHLRQTQQMSDNYREQCINMEQELSQLKERDEASQDIFRQRSERMAKRLKLMNKRYEALEGRRRLEVEGYKTDIKLLRQRLKEVEKQLYKVKLASHPALDQLLLVYTFLDVQASHPDGLLLLYTFLDVHA